MPPFWAPEIVTGPAAFLSWKFPVAPGLKFAGVSELGVEPPLPPHAARASSPTEDRATNGVLSLIYAPFTDGSTRR